MKTDIMKNILLACLSILSILPNYSNGQKKGDAGVIAAAAVVGGAIGAIAAASSVELAKEAMERNMVEWVLSKKDHSKKTTFDLSLMKWEASKKEDLSKVSVVGFKYTEKKEGHLVLLNICSPGWWNDYGVDFSRVKVYEINKINWTKILIAYLNLSK